MSQSPKPSVTYSKLLHLIQSLQSQMDQIPTPPGLQARLLPASILNLCAAEAMMLDIEKHDDWEKNYISLWHSLINNNGLVLDRLNTLSETFHLELSIIHYLPPAGSTEWWALYTFVRLMTECSHIVESKPDSGEEEQRECPICYEAFITGCALDESLRRSAVCTIHTQVVMPERSTALKMYKVPAYLLFQMTGKLPLFLEPVEVNTQNSIFRKGDDCDS
ncbi:uncharacterized protein MELLADRAFT_102840 [Melampsora larici-populina 98AG31]|uniref:Uncharacterized protein n=1 Tax=Melampsora larici-populina (strain 98AG31 / pathotype 3-4-7) TaxID=747676 RepID=F4R9K0_MELLP|nr:uncharacterized protein MELLADRAFT_102840 [Melampsora larici-populina 98AG31]EGG11135.1 hypothetical protein MELLADRAFT_102840 [Melampsora larici-populina 98AG31]